MINKKDIEKTKKEAAIAGALAVEKALNKSYIKKKNNKENYKSNYNKKKNNDKQKNAAEEKKQDIINKKKGKKGKKEAGEKPKRPAGKNNSKIRLWEKTIICVTGTPATGKTTLSRMLGKELGMRHLDVSSIIRQNSLSDGYDAKRHCDIIDEKKLKKAISALILKSSRSMIIDSHLSHYIPNKLVDLCIVTKCNISELKKRLEKRGYSKEKVRENLDSEIFDVCLTEALEAKHNVLVTDTDKDADIDKIRLRLKKKPEKPK